MSRAAADNPVDAGSSTWPRNVLQTPKDLPRRSADHWLCFLGCPFEPKERADDLLHAIQSVCNEIGREVGAEIECVRADSISTPGVIHSDIWRYIELADARIFDVTGHNGNVLLELGVAAACRSQDSVIIVRERGDANEGGFLFDIAPSRHLLFTRSFRGCQEFGLKLKEALIHALTPAPYRPTRVSDMSFPLDIDLGGGRDSACLLSPAMLHRRPLPDGLEFGSPYFFRYSWLTLGDEDHAQVNLRATLRFSDLASNVEPPVAWIGVALRSQHFFANYSHLVYVRGDGSVCYTEPLDELHYRDHRIAYLSPFELSKAVVFDLRFGSHELEIGVDGVHKEIDLSTAPFVRHAGRIRLQTFRCRAVLRHLWADVPERAVV